VKIRVTFDITNEERLLLGLKANGNLVPATRVEMEEVLHAYGRGPLDESVSRWHQATKSAIADIASGKPQGYVTEK